MPDIWQSPIRDPDRPIWPLILWIIFTDLAGDDKASSLIDFIQKHPGDLYACNDEHEEWLFRHLHGNDGGLAKKLISDCAKRLNQDDWAILNSTNGLKCRKSSISQSHTSNPMLELQLKLLAFIWIAGVIRDRPARCVASDISFLAEKLNRILHLPPFLTPAFNGVMSLHVDRKSKSISVAHKSVRGHIVDALSTIARELPTELAFDYPQAWICGRTAIMQVLQQDTSYPPTYITPLALACWVQFTVYAETRPGPELDTLQSSDPIATLADYSSRNHKMLQWISRLPQCTLDVAKLNRILQFDRLTIIAQIQVILQDKETYRTFVSQTGDEARNLLSLLHELIDWPELPTRIRAEFTAALVRLSKKSGCYPDLFGLSGLIRSGSHAVVAGGFGDIWQGLLKGRKVSVKVARVFLDGDVQQFVKAFYTEAILWGQLSHPNVLPLYGIYYLDSEDRSQLCLVSPWMENGNIVEFLRKAPAGSVKHHSLISDIACGMEYLHKSSIVHGDLKGLNILITPSHRACLMDFGLASVANSAIPNWTSLSVQQGGTWRWQAPEILQAQPNSFKGDVYAFGCVCYQVYTGRVPFHDISNDMAVSLKVINGHRPSRPAELPESDDNIWKLIEDCWKADPGERPIAAQVVQRLSGPGNTPSLTNTDSEWDESFPRDLRRSLRHQKIVPSDKELADLLPKQQPGDGHREEATVVKQIKKGPSKHTGGQKPLPGQNYQLDKKNTLPPVSDQHKSQLDTIDQDNIPAHMAEYYGRSIVSGGWSGPWPGPPIAGAWPGSWPETSTNPYAMNSQNNGSSLLGAPQSTISPWLEEPGGYHEQRLAKRPRDWRADYTPRFGIASLLPGRDLSDVIEYSDSTRRSPNPLLAYTGSSSIPALLHDLRQDPFVFIQFPAMGRQHNTLDYAQQATNPPTNFMRLYHPKFPWYIDIEQSHPNGVTVHDVLGQLYLQMLKLITPRHFYNQVLGEGDRHQINNAFRQRCSGHPELITRGVVQVDFFAIEGKFMWLGLAKGKNGMWEIKMQ